MKQKKEEINKMFTAVCLTLKIAATLIGFVVIGTALLNMKEKENKTEDFKDALIIETY